MGAQPCFHHVGQAVEIEVFSGIGQIQPGVFGGPVVVALWWINQGIGEGVGVEGAGIERLQGDGLRGR